MARAVGANNAALLTSHHRQTAFHAEAHALMQAHEANGGRLPSSVTICSDRPPCRACREHLQAIANALGAHSVRVEVGNGVIYETIPGSGTIGKVKE